MIILTKICFVIISGLAAAGLIQWKIESTRLEKEGLVLSYAGQISEYELQQKEEQRRIRQEEDEKQKNRVFLLDFMLTHGSAFGGVSSTMNDGRTRKGTVLLDHILMYGKQPSGREFTYYIEEQGIEICAMDKEDSLLIRSNEQKFEIRESNQNRDEGICTNQAVIKKDVLYYIILESKHELSIKAVKRC